MCKQTVDYTHQESSIQFPDNATNQEKATTWHLIAKITDQDLGFDFPAKPTNKCKFNTRIILRNNNGKICLIRSAKYGYCQLPGGGIDAGESIKQGLRREAREETGFEIQNLHPLGVTVEYRNGSKYDWSRSISFCYFAEPGREVGTSYMPDEIEEGFEPVWLRLDEAVKLFTEADTRLKNDPNRSYSGTFSTRRDLSILRCYQESAHNV